jgi:hypothetical protein
MLSTVLSDTSAIAARRGYVMAMTCFGSTKNAARQRASFLDTNLKVLRLILSQSEALTSSRSKQPCFKEKYLIIIKCRVSIQSLLVLVHREAGIELARGHRLPGFTIEVARSTEERRNLYATRRRSAVLLPFASLFVQRSFVSLLHPPGDQYVGAKVL